jgi:hypothetical protein
MKYFINLTSRTINKFHIIEIIKQPNLYILHITNSSTSADIWKHNNVIKICNTKNKQDYKTITDFINQI